MTQRHVKSLILATGWLITTLTTGHAADWMLDGSTFKAEIHPGQTNREITLENGLIRRVFRLEPNAATVSFENLMSGESIIRAVRPEARLVLDGVPCEVGGLGTQPVQNFLKPGWINSLEANPDAFQFT